MRTTQLRRTRTARLETPQLPARRDAEKKHDGFEKTTSRPARARDSNAADVARSPLAIAAGEKPVRLAPATVLEAIEDALAGALDRAELETRLEKLGFALAPVQPKSGKARYQLGKLILDVERRELADLEAFALTLKGPRGFERERVSISGVTIDAAMFATMSEKLERTIDSFECAIERRGGADLPATLEHLKAFLRAGETKAEQKKEREQEKELAAKLEEVVALLEKLREGGRAPKGIIIYVDGPDGAGKSSTGRILLEALARAGFVMRSESFKAPTEEERQQHWLARFDRGVPSPGEVVYWDRGPAGDAAYGKPNAKKLAQMTRDLERFDAELVKQDILQIKVELSADPEKQAETMGKRLGRRVIADRIEKILRARGELDAREAESLAGIRGKIDPDDFRALASYETIQGRFLDFAKRTGKVTPWNLIDATKRHRARLRLADRFMEIIERWAKR